MRLTAQRAHANALRGSIERVFVMQAAENRFHENEHIRRQAMASF